MTAALAQELAYSNDLPRLLALTDEALAMARRLDEPIALHEALMARGNIAQNVDLLGELPALCAEAISNGDRVTTPLARAQVSTTWLSPSSWTGDRDSYRVGLDAIVALGDAVPPQFRWLLLAQTVGFELRWGSLETAERLAAELLERANETGEPDAALWYLNVMGFTLRQQGRYDEALDLFVPFTETESEVIDMCRSIVAMVLCEAERHDEARPYAERTFPWGRAHPRDQSLLPNLGPLAIAAAELRDLDAAAWLLETLEPLTAYWSAWSAQAPIAPVTTLVGRLRATLGDFAGADAAFDEAVAHCRSTDANYFLADAWLYQGLARRDAGATGDTGHRPDPRGARPRDRRWLRHDRAPRRGRPHAPDLGRRAQPHGRCGRTGPRGVRP